MSAARNSIDKAQSHTLTTKWNIKLQLLNQGKSHLIYILKTE